jgi:lipopolysaccharide transport protein LptA
MAASRVNSGQWAALACLACGSAGAIAAQPRPAGQIDVDGDHLHVDYQRNTLQLKNIVMTDKEGTILIRAQDAKAHSVELSAKDMQWEFSGDVHMEFNGATLDSATATVSFKNNLLDNAHAVGTPAQFSHQLKGATQRSQGHARTIDFDAAKSQLHLAGGVWYSDGTNDINTSSLNYNLADRSIDSNPGAGERVRLHLQLGKGTVTPAPKASTPPPAGAAPATTAPGPAKR